MAWRTLTHTAEFVVVSFPFFTSDFVIWCWNYKLQSIIVDPKFWHGCPYCYGQSHTKGPNQATLIVIFWSVVQFNHTRCVVEIRTLPIRLNPLNAELNPICDLLALLGAHPVLHVSRIKVNTVMLIGAVIIALHIVWILTALQLLVCVQTSDSCNMW
jgi:hypothetical protein